MEAPRVLVIENRPKIGQLLRETLGQEGMRVSVVPHAEDGLPLLEEAAFGALFAYADAPGINDEFLRSAVSAQPRLSVAILISGDSLADVRQRITFARANYLSGPLTGDVIRAELARAMKPGHAAVAAPAATVPRSPGGETIAAAGGSRLPVARLAAEQAPELMTRNPAMRQVLALATRVANNDVPVLIKGEAGVGKESLAREIHRQSRWAAGPFVSFHSAALTEAKLEQELVALCRAGQGGTLLLNHACALPMWAQARLLDVFERRNRPLDDEPVSDSPPRLMAACECDLEAAVQRREFDPRLFYYLHAVKIDVPPLRYRQEDVLPLADHFLISRHPSPTAPIRQVPWHFSDEARQSLLEHPWPGNVPQMASVVARAMVLSDTPQITRQTVVECLGSAVPANEAEMISLSLSGGLREMEEAIVQEVITRCRGNKAAAARALGLHRRTLYRLLAHKSPPHLE